MCPYQGTLSLSQLKCAHFTACHSYRALLTACHSLSQPITACHSLSQLVKAYHSLSQPITGIEHFSIKPQNFMSPNQGKNLDLTIFHVSILRYHISITAKRCPFYSMSLLQGPSHNLSQPITACHSLSQPVTAYHSRS